MTENYWKVVIYHNCCSWLLEASPTTYNFKKVETYWRASVEKHSLSLPLTSNINISEEERVDLHSEIYIGLVLLSRVIHEFYYIFLEEPWLTFYLFVIEYTLGINFWTRRTLSFIGLDTKFEWVRRVLFKCDPLRCRYIWRWWGSDWEL